MTQRIDIYLRFFRTVQSIEDILNVVQRRSDRFGEDIALYRDGLEWVVDETVRLAAERNWEFAYENGDFKPFYEDFDAYARKYWNEILKAESARQRR